MNSKIEIQIWSDIICPWCWIGKTRLEKALEASSLKGRYELVHKAFRLGPGSPTEPIEVALKAKTGGDLNQVLGMLDNVEKIAAGEGLKYNLRGTLYGDTLDGQRLVLWAAKYGKQGDLLTRFYKAYFSEGVSIYDEENLLNLVTSVGLDRSEAKSVLDSDQYKNEVSEDEDQARTYGARGVPFFLLANKYAVGGAQSTEVFLQALEQIASELPKVILGSPDAEGCGPDGCEIPEKK